MQVAALAMIAVPLILLVLGAVILVEAVLARRRRSGSQGAALLRVITGAGLLGWALVAGAWLVADMQYGVIILPLLALVGALVWTSALLGAAGILELLDRRRRAGRQS
ncbi:hypothetical protein ACT3SP_01335 [Brachybacterium sp. AOP43-C2-M15]|uniref:hypothetical protein n=1 Tax=Brachybacterium sp. AOP43-C2-M15 TaxID=3457661 RepID=UPI0040337BB7